MRVSIGGGRDIAHWRAMVSVVDGDDIVHWRVRISVIVGIVHWRVKIIVVVGGEIAHWRVNASVGGGTKQVKTDRDSTALGWYVFSVMQAVPAIQDTWSVYKPLRPVGTEPASLGWDVLPVGHSIIHTESRLDDPAGNLLAPRYDLIGQKQLASSDNPELSNLETNDVAAAASG